MQIQSNLSSFGKCYLFQEIIVLKNTKPGTTRFENSPIPYMTRTINRLKLTRPIKNDRYIRL